MLNYTLHILVWTEDTVQGGGWEIPQQIVISRLFSGI